MEPVKRNLLSIGKFAEASRLSRKALRLYDRQGILAPAEVDGESGYRYYRPDQVRTARLIRKLRQMEMPLAMVRRVVSEPLNAAGLIIEYERAYSGKVSRVQRATRRLLSELQRGVKQMPLEVETRRLDPQLVVSITSRAFVKDLDKRISSNLSALRAFVEDHDGEVDGGPLGLYHGPINEEADGPIEVCLPVWGTFNPAGDVVVRELSGGNAAHVSLRGDQCEFPAVLEAYDAAVDWINGNGFEIADSPRELWLGKRGDGDEEEMAVVWPYR